MEEKINWKDIESLTESLGVQNKEIEIWCSKNDNVKHSV